MAFKPSTNSSVVGQRHNYMILRLVALSSVDLIVRAAILVPVTQDPLAIISAAGWMMFTIWLIYMLKPLELHLVLLILMVLVVTLCLFIFGWMYKISEHSQTSIIDGIVFWEKGSIRLDGWVRIAEESVAHAVASVITCVASVRLLRK